MKITKQRLKEIIKEEFLRGYLENLTEAQHKELPAKVHAKAKMLQSEEGYEKDQAYAIAISKLGLEQEGRLGGFRVEREHLIRAGLPANLVNKGFFDLLQNNLQLVSADRAMRAIQAALRDPNGRKAAMSGSANTLLQLVKAKL
tara:strand:- start:93285 stop:93716 length:432 start_codon:yes stop_codon:yes gene_type:complete